MTAATRHDHLVRPRHVVTAVLVAHDGTRWLPTTLHAVKTQRRPVQRFVAVDTGSRDDTRELLERAVGPSSVLSAPRSAGFAAAAHRAVGAFATAPDLASTRSEAGAPVEWIWLLHDDSAPSPAALELMLEMADELPSAAVIGPKLVGWENHRALLEVGATVDRGGRRETGLEPGELDHGQHDGARDVLSVSTAGMLVRRDVWDELGGLDPALPLFRDDLDFGWRANFAGHRVVVCTRAVVYHAQASASGVRRIDAGSPYRRRNDRRAALRTMLANVSGAWLPWIAFRLLVASLLRAITFVVIKRPLDAWDELCAVVSVYARPGDLVAARAIRKATKVVRARDVRRMLAPPGTRLRHYAEAASQRLALIGATDDRQRERSLFRRIFTQPGVLLVLALLVISLIAQRHVLGGALYGGALLPAPAGASDLWATYTQSWHPTGFGSSTVAPPYLAILAILASILFGSARFAVQVLLLGCVPLAGLAAYTAARPLAPRIRIRIWVAATYALLPVVTGSISSGRLGSAVVVMVLPLVLSSAVRALFPVLQADAGARQHAGARTGYRLQGARPAWGAAIPFTIATAFDPILYALLAPILLVALLYGAARRRFLAVWRALVLLVVPLVLLLPWTARVIGHPSLIVTGVGQTSSDLQARQLGALDVVLLHPGGPGMPPLWLDVVVVLAALAGLLQLTRPWPARLGWLLALVGLAGGLVVSNLHVVVPGAAVAVPGWPGTATTLMGAGMLMSAAVAGARLRARLAATSFGWRQPVAVVVAAAAVATPVAAAALWLDRGTGTLLRAGTPEILPAFITDLATSHDQPRTVVLRPTAPTPGASTTAGSTPGTTSLAYALLRERPPSLGDADMPPARAQVALVDSAVTDLAGGVGEQAATELARLGVRYVMTPLANDDGLGARLAAAGGLLPKATNKGWQIWQVEPAAGRLAIADDTGGDWQLPPDESTSGNVVGSRATPIAIPYAPTARSLVLAEAPSSAWRATIAGAAGRTPLTPTTVAGMQAFELPNAGGDVRVYRAPDRRADWLTLQLVALIIVVLAAVPTGRRALDQRRGPRHGADGSRTGSAPSLIPPSAHEVGSPS